MNAVFPGSFDPFTNGHKDIVENVLQSYDNIVILICNNEEKTYMFSNDEKKTIINGIFKDNKKVYVDILDKGESLGNYAYQNYFTIVKGIRNKTDEFYEKQLSMFNNDQYGVLTDFFKSDGKEKYISSSFVKQAFKYSVDIKYYVHPIVQKMFKVKKGLNVLGITGSIACGKSTLIKNEYKDWQVINMDDLARSIYKGETKLHRTLMEKQVKGLSRLGIDTDVDNLQNTLKKCMFVNDKIVKMCDNILSYEILRMATDKLSKMTGNVIIECASFDKFNHLIDLCDHNILYIKVDKEERIKRLMKRSNIDKSYAKKIVETLGDDEYKINNIYSYLDNSIGKLEIKDG